jgi:hypothetical protein
MDKEEIKKVMSHLGKLSNKKKPRTKKQYRDMANKRWAKHKLVKEFISANQDLKVIKKNRKDKIKQLTKLYKGK